MSRMETRIHEPMSDFVTRGGLAELISSAQAGLEELQGITLRRPETTERLAAAIHGAASACEEEANEEHYRPRRYDITTEHDDLITTVATGMLEPHRVAGGGRRLVASWVCPCAPSLTAVVHLDRLVPYGSPWEYRIPCPKCEQVYTFAWGSR